jgi:hypothetical protein
MQDHGLHGPHGPDRPRRRGKRRAEGSIDLSSRRVHHARAVIRAGGGRLAVDPDLVLVIHRRDVTLLFAAMVALARSDHAGLVDARSELVQLAEAGGADFEEELVTGVADVLACSLPNTSWEEVERAIRVDVARVRSGPGELHVRRGHHHRPDRRQRRSSNAPADGLARSRRVGAPRRTGGRGLDGARPPPHRASCIAAPSPSCLAGLQGVPGTKEM